MKPAAFPALRATRLLDQVRERIRYKHYSLRTEQAYVQWVKVFVKWSGLRHPRDMGGPEIEASLTMLLATERGLPVMLPRTLAADMHAEIAVARGQ